MKLPTKELNTIPLDELITLFNRVLNWINTDDEYLAQLFDRIVVLEQQEIVAIDKLLRECKVI